MGKNFSFCNSRFSLLAARVSQSQYEYNTEYTRKHSAACYHEDSNSTRKTWLRFNTSIVYQLSVA